MKLFLDSLPGCSGKICVRWLVFGGLLGLAAATQGQIYKYQDENGKWHFTDKAPKKGQESELVDIETRGGETIGENLQERLQNKYASESPIADSTMAVVKVVTLAGTGSGFFVTNDGYLVTNKHVVRPKASSSWDATAEKFEQQGERFVRARERLNREKKAIADYESDLARFKRGIALEPSATRASREAEYEEYRQRLIDRKKDYREARRTYNKEYSRYKDQLSDYKWRSANANTAQRFTVQLKDETELSVMLVRLSAEHDLALLKLDGYITPRLTIEHSANAIQGEKVFAMGSPLGLNDYVTSGIITRVSRKSIVTDAKILPGNSGGPLVTPDGHVLGVNTQKLSPSGNVMADGFGIAIPIAVVKQEFPEILKPVAKVK